MTPHNPHSTPQHVPNLAPIAGDVQTFQLVPANIPNMHTKHYTNRYRTKDCPGYGDWLMSTYRVLMRMLKNCRNLGGVSASRSSCVSLL